MNGLRNENLSNELVRSLGWMERLAVKQWGILESLSDVASAKSEEKPEIFTNIRLERQEL